LRKILLKKNVFHYFESGFLKEIEDEVNFSGLTKLSFFQKGSNCEFDSQENILLNLIEKMSDAVIFRQEVFLNLILWEVFSKVNILNKLVAAVIKQTNYEYILWPTEHLTAPKLLVFDMDSTFIEIEVIDELAKRHGVGDLVSEVTESAMRGELDFSESLISRVSCLKGLEEKHINEICRSLPLSSGVKELVDKSKNIHIAIVSGGFTPFVEHLKKTMSLYKVKANNLEITNQLLTGKVLGKIVDAEEKAVFIRLLQKELGLTKNDIMTVGDGANDLLMMKESGFSLAYRAKPTVQAKANGIMNTVNLNHLLNIFKY